MTFLDGAATREHIDHNVAVAVSQHVQHPPGPLRRFRPDEPGLWVRREDGFVAWLRCSRIHADHPDMSMTS